MCVEGAIWCVSCVRLVFGVYVEVGNVPVETRTNTVRHLTPPPPPPTTTRNVIANCSGTKAHNKTRHKERRTDKVICIATPAQRPRQDKLNR